MVWQRGGTPVTRVMHIVATAAGQNVWSHPRSVQLTHPHQPYQRISFQLINSKSEQLVSEKSLIKKIIPVELNQSSSQSVPVLRNVRRRGGAEPVVTVLEPVIVILGLGGRLWVLDHLLWLNHWFYQGFLTTGTGVGSTTTVDRLGLGTPRCARAVPAMASGWVGVSRRGIPGCFTSSPAFLQALVGPVDSRAARGVFPVTDAEEDLHPPLTHQVARFSALWAIGAAGPEDHGTLEDLRVPV
jgi:hypothetical protein